MQKKIKFLFVFVFFCEIAINLIDNKRSCSLLLKLNYIIIFLIRIRMVGCNLLYNKHLRNLCFPIPTNYILPTRDFGYKHNRWVLCLLILVPQYINIYTTQVHCCWQRKTVQITQGSNKKNFKKFLFISVK